MLKPVMNTICQQEMTFLHLLVNATLTLADVFDIKFFENMINTCSNNKFINFLMTEC